MKYKLYDNSKQNLNNVIDTVLTNRGITDVKEYLNLTESSTHDYNLLENMNRAVELFDRHACNEDVIAVLFDCDVDGFTSGSAMYNYVKKMDNNYPIFRIVHYKNKSHGLDGIGTDVIIPENCKLLIVPDAGTNDCEYYTQLNQQGIDVLILDHHEAEHGKCASISCVSDNITITVNNQMCNYPNKNFSGVGVTYKFLKALDAYYWTEYADDYLDLVAVGNIGDNMDLREPETRYYCDKGLKQINNKMIQAFINKQEYSTKGVVNIHNISWYIVPLINAMIRIGSLEERELMAKAFCEEYEEFPYKTRATKDKPSEEIMEDIYTRVARLCANTKSRQDKLRKKCTEELCEIIDGNFTDNDKAVIIDGTDVIDSGLTGVVAIKIAEKYNRPCLLFNKTNNGYGGSARNIDNMGFSLKDVVNNTEICSGQGHPNAFGLIYNRLDLESVRNKINELLVDEDFTKTYMVDFVLDVDEFEPILCIDCDKMKDILCQGIDDCKVVIKGIRLNKNEIILMGKNEDCISFFMCDDEVKAVGFSEESKDIIEWLGNGVNEDIVIDVVCEPSVNFFNGIKTPQIKLLAVDIVEKISNNDDSTTTVSDDIDSYDDNWDGINVWDDLNDVWG